MSAALKIMLVAAEASGDALGAGLAKALNTRCPDTAFVGVGGPKMAAEGVVSPFNIADLSIFGWIDGLRAYGRVKARVADTVALALRERPDAVVLIDSWGFTIRVAKALRAALPGVPLIKYVGPQVWASRPGRARTLAGAVDHLLALYSFDAPWFEAEGLPTTVVGSPALHVDMASAHGTRFRKARGIAADAPLLLVLPGSRPSEIARMTPVYEQAVAILKAADPALNVAVVAAGTVADDVAARVGAWPFRVQLVQEAEKYDAMRAATVALATSGTVSTELALASAPMVISYRFDPLSYAIMRPFFTGKFATLFNTAADAMIAPELIQTDATGEKLAAAVARLLSDPAARADQSARQTAALNLMGREGRDPSEIAADAVLKVIGGSRFEAVRRHIEAMNRYDWPALAASVSKTPSLRLTNVAGRDWTLSGLYRHITQAWELKIEGLELAEGSDGSVEATLNLSNGLIAKCVTGEYRLENGLIEAVTLTDSAATAL